MSRLRAVLDRINDLEATIAKIERDSGGRESDSLRLTLKSLENRRETLRDTLAEITRQESVEICDYRIIPESENSYAVSAVTSALQSFQDLVILVFDAITTGPKQRASFDAAVISKTRLDFGFAYSGSLGVILTINNERLLGIDSHLDDAISNVFGLAKTKSQDDLKSAAKLYGLPTIRKLYSWAKTHRDYDMSAEIKWIREKEIRNKVLAKKSEMAEICTLIESKSDEVTVSVTLKGVLSKWDVDNRTFAFHPIDSDPIRGTLAKSVNPSSPPKLVPGSYVAHLVKTTTMRYSSDEEKITWILSGLVTPE